MGYLSKDTILRAYEELSHLTNDPSAQGATQATSALRYVFALDEFTKRYKRDCDTSDKKDRDAFISFVGNVVSVNNELYTANFFNAIKNNQDYAVGSNFFSVNVVRNSQESPNKEFTFPKRGNNPLFVVRNGHLIERVEMHSNLRAFLHTPILRNAFAVWLVRFDKIEGDNIFSSIINKLVERYSSSLVNALQLNRVIVEDIANAGLTDTLVSFSISDFPKAIQKSQNAGLSSGYSDEGNIAIVNSLKEHYSSEELSAELQKMYDAEHATGVHLFGLKFGKFLVSNDVKNGQIVVNAGIPETYKTELSKALSIYRAIRDGKFGLNFNQSPILHKEETADSDKLHADLMVAMRTKPFLLLAGISGTGKSRIVKQMAFDSCPDTDGLRADETSPGNYCLIEVKPNWHDSTELLGYESKIGGAHYVLTPFVSFLVKAMLYPEVPFFVCLDEMNLAPVEQYFAEFLSVLESRTKVGDRIVSEPLVKADIFKKYSDLSEKLFAQSEENAHYDNVLETSELTPRYGKEAEVFEILKDKGLRIPPNVIVIGTVNMDETTHQFSRKVIDRAMTIEMNLPEGDPFMDFYNNASRLVYRENPVPASLYLSTEVKASDVIDALAAADAEKTERMKGEVAKFLNGLNTALDGTPFKVAYRVQNELLLYVYQLWREDKDNDWESILSTSCDQILMMKVLPRIEGDEELLENPLERLATFCAAYPEASKKIAEMKTRLDQSHFASFWP